MKMKDRTKVMFADELERMLKTESMDQVRIVDLCRRCGATPPTFYYYFRDKYDLAAWIYLHDISEAFGDRKPEYSPKRLEQSLELMARRRSFYQKVLAENSQNSILRYGMKYMSQMVRDVMIAATGKEPTEYQMLEARHHTYGIFGLQQEWINGESSITAAELAQFLYDHTPDYLKTAFSSYAFWSEEILSNAGRNL
jgi:AcrR family transcriptional regulator